VGFAIGGNSIIAIETSKNAVEASQLIPIIEPLLPGNPVQNKIKPGYPKRGDLIGTLEIARLSKSIPIYEGTEKAQLLKGAGHFEQSVLPGEKDNSVVVGHRDSVFTEFGSLQIGDELVVSTTQGKFIYRITKFRIVSANDRTVIVPTKKATLTLSTCYPFHFIGNAPKRFIVISELKARA
jgi:sortase A